MSLLPFGAGTALAMPVPAYVDTGPQTASEQIQVSPTQLFAIADAARDAGDYTIAETAYRALAGNPDRSLRSEARFRLGMMLADKLHRYRDAAVEFRRILDEQPGAARVRLELARMQAALGRSGSAARELRAVGAGALPPEVAQQVRFYESALLAQRRIGGSAEVAIAPDTNINRATRSDTLGTVIGDFQLDRNAQARSGIGIAARGQFFARATMDKRANLLVQLSGGGNLYRQSQFDDYAAAIQAGPEYRSGHDRITFAFGPGWRWYGQKPFSTSWGATVDWLHPAGRRGQVRLGGGISHVDNRFNALQSGDSFNVNAGGDRSFTPRTGGGLQVNVGRDTAADPGYANASGGANVYLFREIGQTTAVVSLGYNHLEADARVFLFAKRRVEDRAIASLGGTFRALRVGAFAPYGRVRYERNWSTVELYDYRRLALEAGITSAF